MKKSFLLIFILAVFLFAHGQSTVKVEAEIRKLEQVVVTAILNGDTNTLKQVWAPKFMVNNPRSEVSVNRDAVLQLQRAGMINYSKFEKVIEQMLFKKNMVITMGNETIVSKTDIPGAKAGEPYKRRFTNIWEKKNGSWQQIARHASVICQ